MAAYKIDSKFTIMQKDKIVKKDAMLFLAQ